ncbi:MAG: D-xylose transport system permease protein xylG [Chloroflexota bacterium]|nr:D-xylose transport system permease protein xylG [Chloroflexota bacterium]
MIPSAPPPGAAPDVAPDLTAAAVEVLPPELVADSVGQYAQGWLARVRGGDAGVLPVILALVILAAVFQIVSPNHVFLSPGNLVNLFIQSSVFMVLAMAEGFALLLGEIDLSIGYVAAVGGIIAAELVQPGVGWPWWSAVVAALFVCGLIGALQGTLITRLRLPSFVVTLAGFLIWFGFMIVILGPAGGVSIASPQQPDQRVLYNLVQGTIDPVIAWIGLTVIVAVFGVVVWLRDASRRRAGLVAPPATLTALKIVFLAAIGIVVVAICDIDRGVVLPITGVPWVVPLVLGVLVVWTVLLERTKFGRYVYAVGGNPEATRRAGISLAAIRTWAFALCSLTAGIAGLLYASWQGGMNTNVNGGQLVLYAVAAAVIGGTSLFGGRGRMVHGVLGGLVIGTIYNGLYLLGFPVQWQLIATGLVLLAAVIVDSFSRRGAGIGTGARA